MAAGRRRWARQLTRFDPEKLVFLDESGAKTNMTRLYGRSAKGSRCHASAPCGRWESTTMISSVRVDGTTACMAVSGATNTEVFRAYVSEVLAPTLREGDIVVMDNLGAHKNKETLAIVHACGADALFLPPYSPDLNPIELMWSKIKALLRRFEARDTDELIDAIGRALDEVTPSDARNWFAHCGYNFI